MENVMTLRFITSEIEKRTDPVIVIVDNKVVTFNQAAEKLWQEIGIDLLSMIGEEVETFLNAEQTTKMSFHDYQNFRDIAFPTLYTIKLLQQQQQKKKNIN